jgi:hypothetical protein
MRGVSVSCTSLAGCRDIIKRHRRRRSVGRTVRSKGRN